MKKKYITLKQIAKELELSISTVSKSLKDSHEISKETKDKVLAFAKMLNYKPNNIALSLKYRKTKNIAVIIPEIVHNFFATVIKGIEHEANKRGYNVIICLSDESFDKEVINMEMLASGSIDGFIISLSKETQQLDDFHHIQEVINQGMPVVMFDRVTDRVKCDKIVIDDVKASQNAVQFLINKGLKKIGLLTTVDYVSVGKLRTIGYIQALKNNRINVNEDFILKIEDIENSYTEIEAHILKHQFDAVFAVNELFAVSAIKAATKNNIKIPDEIAVVGFTDGLISKYSTPGITTVSQEEFKIGKLAAKRLIDRLEIENELEEKDDIDIDNYITDVVDTHLVVRESTPTL